MFAIYPSQEIEGTGRQVNIAIIIKGNTITHYSVKTGGRWK
jgi:hypothetical protein